MFVSESALRTGYEKARGIAKDNSVDPDLAVKTANLFAYGKLENGQNVIPFSLSDDDKVLPSVERLLREKSQFHAAGVNLCLVKVPIINGKSMPGLSVCYQYPNDSFTGTDVNGIPVTKLLEMIYNGVLKLEIDDKIVLEDYCAKVMRYRSVTEDAMKFMFLGRYFHFIGSLKNKLTLKLPDKHTYGSIAGDGTFEIYVVIGFTGFEIRTDQDKVKSKG